MALTECLSSCVNAFFRFRSRSASVASTGFHAVFSPGAHSISAPLLPTDKRTPRVPLGRPRIRLEGKLGRKSLSPVQERPASTDRHTPLADATVTSSGSLGDAATQVRPVPRMEPPL